MAAVVLLALASLTDLLDGRIARRFNQVYQTRRDARPAADRLYNLRDRARTRRAGIIPWWLLVVLVGRDVTMAALLPALKSRGFTSLPVNFIGKAATFCLLYALPLILLGAGPWVISPAASIIGWAFAIWGAFRYWWAGLRYIWQPQQLLRSVPPVKPRAS